MLVVNIFGGIDRNFLLKHFIKFDAIINMYIEMYLMDLTLAEEIY